FQKEDEAYALRPEGTASVVRAYIENALDKTQGFAKLFYLGPMFRRERPQKGRLRQFHHIGCEAIGSLEPDLDVEVIALAVALLEGCSVQDFSLKLNSLGCQSDKQRFTSNLRSSLEDKKLQLCPDCQNRLEQNPLRILDCKQENCKRVVDTLAIKDNILCADCQAHFTRVRKGLDALHIAYQVVPQLVRGLDYYTGTVFELAHPGLGSQDALGAGGRYNNLVQELGGPAVGAVGFALGVERLLLVARPQTALENLQSLVYVISLGDEAKEFSVVLLSQLRKAAIACDTDYEKKSLKAAMRKANDVQARFVVIIGDDELQKKVVTVKDMRSSTQEEVALSSIVDYLKQKTG
nr:histidine--tRNA ligase [Candidatus Omnitrophota bacterium]